MRLPPPATVALTLAGCSSALTLAGCSPAPAPVAADVQPGRTPVPAAHVTTTVSSRAIGRLGDVLTDGGGHTVYANSGEPSEQGACAAECRRTWPLLLAPASGLPAVTGGASAVLLSVVTVGGVRAVAYAGHPLHEYVGDPSAGDAFGQGIQGVWSCVTLTGAPAKGSP